MKNIPELNMIVEDLKAKTKELEVLLDEQNSKERKRGTIYVQADIDRIFAEMKVLQEKSSAILKASL